MNFIIGRYTPVSIRKALVWRQLLSDPRVQDGPVSYRFGDPVDMGTPPSLNLREFGDPRVDLGTPLSIDVNGCTAIDPKDYKSVGCREQVMIQSYK